MKKENIYRKKQFKTGKPPKHNKTPYFVCCVFRVTVYSYFREKIRSKWKKQVYLFSVKQFEQSKCGFVISVLVHEYFLLPGKIRMKQKKLWEQHNHIRFCCCGFDAAAIMARISLLPALENMASWPRWKNDDKFQKNVNIFWLPVRECPSNR